MIKLNSINRLLMTLFIPPALLCQSSITKAQPSFSPAELITRITNAYPAFSPDGKKFAYMSNADGDFDIYVRFLHERVIIKATDAPERDGTPVWSPDGSHIAFQSFRDGHSQVYIMDADGSKQRNISNSDSHDEHPFWSADGERILFCSTRSRVNGKEDENIDIYEMRKDGSNVHRITHTPEVETYASWSPDASKIVCRKILANEDWEIVVMNSDGTNPVNISNHVGIDGWPVWSPDGKKIAFASEYGDNTRIFIMNADGTNKVRISDDKPMDDRQPWWHPDGSLLLFSRYVWFQGDPWYEASEIYIIKIKA
ncbi:MAG: hypothetical protein ACE5G1_05495 [bacterium]